MADTIRTTGQLGPRLKRLRKDKGWSQAELGRKIGLSQERISVIENHPGRVSIDHLLTLLMALDAELRITPRHALPAATAGASGPETTPTTKDPGSW
ncbi:MAG: helix-turn-helix transcriptional regulator [Rhodocyclaceae bacterium]|nr:helix-turn-helix transcriptional regulator [Rhodocyclaceae bacterium]